MSNSKKTNKKVEMVFAVRGKHSVGTEIIAKSGLKQLSNRNNDKTQLILSGNSSINLRKRNCFINATINDYYAFESALKNATIDCECVKNGNAIDKKRPHRVYFNFDKLSQVCDILAQNTLNCNGFDIV